MVPPPIYRVVTCYLLIWDYVPEIYPFIFDVITYQKIREKGICRRYGHGHHIYSILLKIQKLVDILLLKFFFLFLADIGSELYSLLIYIPYFKDFRNKK